MKRDLIAYFAILVAAVAIQYLIELQWSATLALHANPWIPWIIDAAVYLTLGGLAWASLRARSRHVRLTLLALVAVLPHALFEITHGSDPAYPYIGLILIVPDLIWVSIGAGIVALVAARRSSSSAAPSS